MTERITARCVEIRFDVFRSHDPPDTRGPAPGHIDYVLANRVMQPFPDDTEEFVTLLEDRCQQVRYSNGCLWA